MVQTISLSLVGAVATRGNERCLPAIPRARRQSGRRTLEGAAACRELHEIGVQIDVVTAIRAAKVVLISVPVRVAKLL